MLKMLAGLSDKRIAVWLFAACIALYLAVFAVLLYLGLSNGTSIDRMLALDFGDTSDVTEYIDLANTMLESGRFAIAPEGPPEYLRVPGYPALLALILFLFATLYALPFVQILLSAITVALIYLLGARYFPRPVAIAAAAVYMLDPIVIYAAWTPISESLFMLLLVGSVYALGSEHRRAWLPYVAAGILFGLSVYVRPTGIYLAPLLALFALVPSGSWRIAAQRAGIFLIVFACVLTPWMIRNYSLSGHFSFSSTGPYNLYAANMPIFEQFRTGTPYRETQQKYNARFGTNEEDILRSFEYSDEQMAIALEVIGAHPMQYLLFHTIKSMQLFVGSSIVNVTYHMHQFGILAGEHAQGEGAWGMITQGRWSDAFVQTFTHFPRLVERVFWLLLYLGMLYTTFVSVYRRSAHALWIFSAFLLIHAIALLTGPSSDDTRYRMPLEPFLLLLGTFAAYDMFQRFSRHTKK